MINLINGTKIKNCHDASTRLQFCIEVVKHMYDTYVWYIHMYKLSLTEYLHPFPYYEFILKARSET